MANDLLLLGSGASGSGLVAPANTVAPAVSGTVVEGQTLSTTDGTWTGTPAPTFTYQWQRDDGGGWANIGSATNSTYVLVSADIGCDIRCVVTGTNANGNAAANSNEVGPISDSEYLLTTPGAGSWTCPAGWSVAQVECWGGGGGGPGHGSRENGGGGGAYSIETSYAVTPNSEYAYSVGAAGVGRTGSSGAGTAGGDTYWVTTGTVLAKGGGGGLQGGSGPGAGGAAGSGVGDTKYSGGTGGNGATNSTGGGGGSSAGTGANGGTGVAGSSGGQGGTPPTGGGAGGAGGVTGSRTGKPGTAPGGGGGAGYGDGASDGGDGAVGRIRLTWVS